LKLSAKLKDKVRSGELSAGHAKALLALSSTDDQELLAEEILRRALSVRQAEKRAASMAAGDKITHLRRRDPFTRDAEEKLSRRLQTRVRIVRKRRGGRIELSFGSEEELIGLFEKMMRNQWQ
jgi:ParB family transcriptional regulator, chromosome partitioning protein